MFSYKNAFTIGRALNIGVLAIFIVGIYAYCLADDVLLFPERFVQLTVSCLVIYVIILIVSSMIKNFSANRTLSVLTKECDPSQYLDKVQTLPKMPRYIDSTLVDLQYCKVVALACSDRTKEARDELSEIIIWRYKAKRKNDIIYMLSLICLSARILHEEDLFEENYVALGTLLGKKPPKDAYAKAAFDYYTRITEKLAYLECSDYESLIRSIDSQEREVGASNRFALVKLEYEKVDYLEKVEDSKGARRSLEFVIEHGNKLNYVEKAEERLKTLESKIETANVCDSKWMKAAGL